MEADPTYIVMQISSLRIWYFSIIAVVLVAVILAVGSLWLNARAQIALTQKKDDFVSAVSHELRTPLNAIIGFADLLLENIYGQLNEEQKEFIIDIKSSARVKPLLQ